MSLESRIKKALYAARGNLDDGAQDKAHAIDQMVRALTGCPMVEKKGKDFLGKTYTYQTFGESQEYLDWVAAVEDGDDGPYTYEWDNGTGA